MRGGQEKLPKDRALFWLFKGVFKVRYSCWYRSSYGTDLDISEPAVPGREHDKSSLGVPGTEELEAFKGGPFKGV